MIFGVRVILVRGIDIRRRTKFFRMSDRQRAAFPEFRVIASATRMRPSARGTTRK